VNEAGAKTSETNELMEIMHYNTDLIQFIQNAARWAITEDTSKK